MLRHRDARIPTAAKDRYRAFLERNVPQLKLATPQDEKRSPTKADEGYESATAWLLAQVTDRERFRLIFEENVNYGFRRNIWALKPLALLVDGLVIAAIVAAIAVSWKGDATSVLQAIDKPTWAGCLFTLVHMLAFTFVHREWVRVPAEAIAKQLLASCDVLGNDGKG